MNGKGGGCCIARYGGGGGGMYGMSKVDRIMLKYRPIAPKPVVAGSGGSSTENSGGNVKSERTKRKYVRVKKNKKKKETSSKRKYTPPPISPQVEQEVVTLSLLPETPTQKQTISSAFGLVSPTTIKCNCSSNITTTKKSEPMWLDFNNEAQKLCLGHMKSVVPVFSKPIQPAPPKVVSYVTVECVTDTWVDIPGLGCTDEERLRNMEHDTCPSFISDGQDRVVWTNKAYRQMAAADNISVILVRKDNWTPLPLTFPAFTCKARVTSAINSNRTTTTTTTLPCDVWRMERGACAWRLDVKAALSLGR